MTSAPAVPPVTAAEAAAVAATKDNKVGPFLRSQAKGAVAPGKATWHLVTLEGSSAAERAALAWLIAEAVMQSRCGAAPSYTLWRDAALAGNALAEPDRKKLLAFIRSVFGTPDKPGSQDHLEGHVAEWLWYLQMRERQEATRKVALLDAPKFSVTEPGPDGFVVYERDGASMIFRLWELKKQVGKSKVNSTVRDAYDQLKADGDRYLAQLTSIHADKTGPVGELCAQLVDLWVEPTETAGAAVGVTSGTLPPPRTCFTTMGKQLTQFVEPGQLEGMLCALEDFRELALAVRSFVWSAL